MINLFTITQTLFEFQNSTNTNRTGLDSLFIYVAQTVPIFFPFMLFSLWIIVLAGTYFSASRLFGKSDFAGSFAVASFITMIAGFTLNLIDNLIDLYTLSILVAINVIGIIFLYVNTRPRL